MIAKHTSFSQKLWVFPFNFKQLECPLSEKRRHPLSEHPEENDSQLWVEVKTSKVGSEQRKTRRGIWSTDTFFFSQSLQGTWRPQVTSLEYSLLSSVCYLSPVFLGSRRQLCPQCFMGRFQQKPLNLRYSMEDRTKRKINHSIQAWFGEPVSFLGLVIGLWVTRRQLWTESSVQHR